MLVSCELLISCNNCSCVRVGSVSLLDILFTSLQLFFCHCSNKLEKHILLLLCFVFKCELPDGLQIDYFLVVSCLCATFKFLLEALFQVFHLVARMLSSDCKCCKLLIQ